MHYTHMKGFFGIIVSWTVEFHNKFSLEFFRIFETAFLKGGCSLVGFAVSTIST